MYFRQRAVTITTSTKKYAQTGMNHRKEKINQQTLSKIKNKLKKKRKEKKTNKQKIKKTRKGRCFNPSASTYATKD